MQIILTKWIFYVIIKLLARNLKRISFKKFNFARILILEVFHNEKVPLNF